jgi:hypothetical protein
MRSPDLPRELIALDLVELPLQSLDPDGKGADDCIVGGHR